MSHGAERVGAGLPEEVRSLEEELAAIEEEEPKPEERKEALIITEKQVRSKLQKEIKKSLADLDFGQLVRDRLDLMRGKV